MAKDQFFVKAAEKFSTKFLAGIFLCVTRFAKSLVGLRLSSLMPQNKQTNTYRELNQQGQEVLFPGKEVVEIKIEEFNHFTYQD